MPRSTTRTVVSKRAASLALLFALVVLAVPPAPVVSAGPTAARGVLRQTTAFTYQGQLTEAGTPANGDYDFWRAEEFPEQHFGNAQAYGLVAQEVEQVLPELVSADERGYKQVDYSKLPLLLLQAVKDLKAESDQLKQQQELFKRQQADPTLGAMLNAIKEQQQQIEQLKGELSQLRAATGVGQPTKFQQRAKSEAAFSAEESSRSRTLRAPRLDAVEATVVRSR